MIRRMRELRNHRETFAFETTLAGVTHVGSKLQDLAETDKSPFNKAAYSDSRFFAN